MNAIRQSAFIAPGAAPVFPRDDSALAEPNGLIAIGGDLAPERLIAAYRRGIFPWYESGQPILWWTPDPRLILLPQRFHAGHTLRRALRRGDFDIRFDSCFDAVIRTCAAPRGDEDGTWITPEMIAAYGMLHQQGFAHSVEVWRDSELIGGLYGIAMGTAFFGESMFSRESGASKLALHALCQRLQPWPDAFIDCQVSSRHLLGLGAELVPRLAFARMCATAVGTPGPWGNHLP
ncbi:MAG: leucyl/phenylalanyl-tRNA--protein transferase [Gammaproteobacteria bacterium]